MMRTTVRILLSACAILCISQEAGFRFVHAAASSVYSFHLSSIRNRAFSICEWSNRNHCLTRPFSSFLSMRGGSLAEDYDEDIDSDEDEDDKESEVEFDDDQLFDDAGFDIQTEGDFNEQNIAGRALEMWKITPPLTKAYLSASMIATAIGFLFNKNQFPELFLLDWKPTLFRLQLWRPFTAFLNFGPFGFSYVMTGHFVWTYMSTLERLHHDKPYDFWVMILFGCITMVAGYSLLGISPRFLGHNLSTFLVYIWSRYHEGMEVNVMELFNARAETLPWFFLAQVS